MSAASLEYLFSPKSVAVAGVSGDSNAWSAGRAFMKSLIDCGFKGSIYGVNPGGGEAFGLRIYQSLKHIPGTVDYVISAIPVQYTPRLVEDCAAKRVRAIHFFTAGFSEIGDEEGKRLESEILKIARHNDIRIIGPNCMGLYCPKTGLSFAADFPEQIGFPKQSGPVGLISQSGGNSIYCIREASTRGVYFSKVISYGNAIDLNEIDFLEYLTQDPETEVIAAYIEGVRDGSCFMEALKEATSSKPVIILKVGATEGGARAAASHTSAIAGSDIIWSSLLKQVGAIQVFSMEEIIDMALLFLKSSPPRGRNTAVIGLGGGASVLAADDCYKAGLVLPMLPAHIRRKLKDISIVEAGRFFVNPVDINIGQPQILIEAIKAIADWDGVDLLVVHMSLDGWALVDAKELLKPSISSLTQLSGAIDKPAVVVIHSEATEQGKRLGSEVYALLNEVGLPVYPSIKRAAMAISRFLRYHEWHRSVKKNDAAVL